MTDPIEYFQLPGRSPKYPHVKVFVDDETDENEFLVRVPFITDCLNAMEAAHISKDEREDFLAAMLNALIVAALGWVTLAREAPVEEQDAEETLPDVELAAEVKALLAQHGLNATVTPNTGAAGVRVFPDQTKDEDFDEREYCRGVVPQYLLFLFDHGYAATFDIKQDVCINVERRMTDEEKALHGGGPTP